MVGAAATAATAQMVSVVPVVVTAGIVTKIAQTMMPTPGQAPRRRRRRDVYSRGYSGDFSNVGY